MIKKIELSEGFQTTDEKLEVIRLKVNEIIEYLDSKTKQEVKP